MSLTSCLRKAGDALPQADRIALLERARVLRASGVPNVDAGRQAVAELIASVEAEIAGMAGVAQEVDAPAAERFEVGRALTKEQRKQVLGTLVDVYKAKGADREMKGQGRDGNERFGYVHSPELFEKSDITSAMVRYYVTLPDGRRAHPSELFPDYTQSDIEAEIQRRENAERADTDEQRRAMERADRAAADTPEAAMAAFRERNKGPWETDWRTGKKRTLAVLQKGGKFYALTDDDSALLERMGRGGWALAPSETPAAEAPKPERQPGKVENFGEALPPPRRAQQKLDPSLSEADIANRSLADIWPQSFNDAIEDIFVAASAHTLRDAIPSKPRMAYKLKQWAQNVKMLREMVLRLESGVYTRERLMDGLRESYALRHLASKIALLENIDRAQWKRVGRVEEYPEAYRFDEGKKVPSPHVMVEIDGKTHGLNGSGLVADQIDSVSLLLGKEVKAKRMQFEVRGHASKGFRINKKGDSEYRALMTFPTSKEAFAAREERYDELVQAWEKVKARDNVTERDLRSAENRPRAGEDYRKGKDITEDEFKDAFGFRGGEFGKWVSQGKGAQERQSMLNRAFDGLMDLARILDVPPRALSLNGTLGLAFGSRGSGWASAHFEPGNLVINLTKTRGAGALAHEWFHSLDNYFARLRNDGKETPFTGSQAEYRNTNYITHKPEPLMVRKDGKGVPMLRRTLEERRARNPDDYRYKAEEWQPDPLHPQGVRPEVEARFDALVQTLKDAPFTKRSALIDEGRGYWSSTLERAARSFEAYILQRMAQQGFHNDYLANVTSIEDFKRDPERYPYPTPQEIEPIAKAFDDLFGTIETRADDAGNVAMYSRRRSTAGISMRDAEAIKAAVHAALPNAPEIVLHDAVGKAPHDLLVQIRAEGAQDDIEAVYWNGKIHVFPAHIASIERAEFVIGRHEVRHHGMRTRYGAKLDEVLMSMWRANPELRQAAQAIVDSGRAKRNERVKAVEEALADMPVERIAQLRQFDKLVAAVRQWLRQMAVSLRRRGYAALADAIDPKTWTDNDVAAFVFRAEAMSGAAGQLGGPVNAGEARASRSPTTQQAYESRIDALFSGEKAALQGVKVLDRSDVLAMLGMGDGPVELAEGKVLAGRGNHPNMTAAAWKMVPEWLENPAAVFDSDTVNGRLVVVAPEPVAGAPALIIVEPSERRGEGVVAHLLANAYDKDGGPPPFARWISDGKLRYVDQKEFPAILRASGLQLPGTALQNKPGTARILTQKNLAGYRKGAGADDAPSQEARFSRAEPTDSAAFRKWFGDSKVVDADGKPLVVYHGTGRTFDTFDSDAESAQGTTAQVPGHWFATDPRVARLFGARQVAAYLKIRNPYEIGAADYIQRFQMDAEDPDAFRKHLEAHGHDGLRITLEPEYENGLGPLGTEEWGQDNYVVFRPEQIKSATGNRGTFDAADPDIRFSRATGASIWGRIDQRSVRNAVNDLMSSPGKVSWWEKSIGTQYAKAERYAKHADTAGFKTVFDAVQDYHEDISTLANEAASAAPSVLPRLDGWRDLAKSGLSTADAKAVAAPVFSGTLEWARDADGRLVKIDDLEAAAEKMDVHDKAHALFSAGRITERVLKMWQGLPIEQFETIINGKYEREFLQAGAVFTPDELRTHFKLTDRQISHYQQIRAAIDTSLDQAATADVLRLLKDAPQDFKRMAMEDRAAFRRAVLEFLDTQEGADDLRADIQDKFDRIDSLKAHGYAPLMRFGKFYVDVKDQGTGESLYFGLYESRREANAALRDMREAFPEGVASAGVISQQAHKLFSGIPLESLEMFAQAIGAEQSDVYQQYIKLAKNNRSAMKRLLKRKGTAGFNDNPTRVLAAFLTSNARLASGSMNLLGASQAAQEIRAGDVKDEAIKLLEAVQNPTETAAAIRGFMFVNFIGGSVASAVVNLTQTVTMTLPYLTQWGGLAKATGHWSAALRMAANKVDASTELGKALKQAEADGIVSPQEIHHLQAEAMGSWGTNPALKKAAFVWGSMFGLAEQFNRRVTFIAAYQTAREQNMADPFAFAEKAVVETQGLYNRGNSANWARNPVGAAALQFKQFTVHYLEWLQRMWQSGPQGKRAVGYALVVLMLAAGTGGLPGMDDLEDLIDTLAQAMGYDFSAKSAWSQFLANMVGKAGAEFVTRGISGVAGMPIDVSLRMGMGNLIPATGLLLRSNTDSARDLSEIAGAAGGMFRQVKDASEKALAGDFLGAAVKAAPMAIQNAAKGVQIWTTGEYRDERGRRVMDATMVDGLMKFIGFQPAEVAAETDKLRQAKRSEDFAKKVESEIVAKWARGLVDGEPEAVRGAQEELRNWNQKNPGTPIRINRAQVAQRARKMRETRAERFSKTVAPERRQLVAQ